MRGSGFESSFAAPYTTIRLKVFESLTAFRRELVAQLPREVERASKISGEMKRKRAVLVTAPTG
jgi:hypothetical protein